MSGEAAGFPDPFDGVKSVMMSHKEVVNLLGHMNIVAPLENPLIMAIVIPNIAKLI